MLETTIAYYVTNIELRNRIFSWTEFSKKLQAGPEVMKQELQNIWNETREKLKSREDLIILDIDKEVTIDDFDITVNTTQDGIKVFFFIFPDTDKVLAQCKATALALTDKTPRYFTMEYFKIDNGNLEFIIGEWDLNLKHLNYGKIDNPTIDSFAKHVHSILSKENK